MATMVVAGRVEENVKRTVDAILRVAGESTSSIISKLWQHIADTGTVPSFDAEDVQDSASELEDFFSFVDGLPPAPAWLIDMDREGMRDVLASRYV